jgi:class 3 adenylate cyclase
MKLVRLPTRGASTSGSSVARDLLGRGAKLLGIGVAVLAILLVAASLWISGRERDADEAVTLTMRNETRIAGLMSLLQDAELGQRGFLLTGDAFYLEPYARAISQIGEEIDQLDASLSSDPRQIGNVATLRTLVAQKLSELRQTVERRRSGDEAGAMTVLRSGQGKIIMDGLREVLTHMREEEEGVMIDRAFQARRSAFRMEAAIVALSLLSAGLAFLALRASLRRAKSAEASRDEILARLDRRLMAIMALDVVGYSRLMEADEAGTLKRLTDQRRVLDPIIERHGGTIVSSGGDSVLATFGSALAAVDCGVEMQASTNGDGLPIRIGVNVGDVIEQGGDVFGDAVNIAARLEALAEPGGICVTRAVRDHVGKQRRYAFDDMGFQSVKNLSEPVSAFRVRAERPVAA